MAVVCVSAACTGSTPVTSGSPVVGQGDPGEVVSVADGDTVVGQGDAVEVVSVTSGDAVVGQDDSVEVGSVADRDAVVGQDDSVEVGSVADRDAVAGDVVATTRPAASRPALSIVSPMNRSTVTAPFTVVVEATNLQLAPNGAVRDGEAHLHVITSGECVPAGEVIVDNAVHLHHGDGSADLTVDLPPGDYRLCIQAGDGFHVALGITSQISVTVVEP